MQQDKDCHSDSLANAALRSIRENDLRINAQTFSIWYEYHRGDNASLREAIDSFEAAQRPISAANVAELYDRFIGNAAEIHEIRETSDKMQQTLGQLLSLVKEASISTHTFGNAVRRVSTQFTANECSVGELVQCLLEETKNIGIRTSRIETHLVRNAELMQSMRQSLEEARKDASTDPLTGLANRRSFDKMAQAQMSKATRYATSLSLLLLDLDNFKNVNDTWGHAVGDEVLKLASAALRSHIRDTDLAARYGGEEFAVLLPGLDVEAAAEIGNRVRQALANHRFMLRSTGQRIGQITISVGAAAFGQDETLGQWVERADAALYKAKQSGRNRLIQAAVPDLHAPMNALASRSLSSLLPP